MKCLLWNVRGAGKVKVTSSIRILIALHSIDVCVILEPRISGSKAISTAKKLGFQNFHLEEASGFSGGIWMGWNGQVTNLDIVLSTKQSVSAIITTNDQPWVITAVYGSPQPNVRRDLWKLLDEISSIVEDADLPWIIAGDFNEITCISEKKEGNDSFTNTSFANCLEKNGLIDMGFIGEKFT